MISKLVVGESEKTHDIKIVALKLLWGGRLSEVYGHIWIVSVKYNKNINVKLLTSSNYFYV